MLLVSLCKTWNAISLNYPVLHIIGIQFRNKIIAKLSSKTHLICSSDYLKTSFFELEGTMTDLVPGGACKKHTHTYIYLAVNMMRFHYLFSVEKCKTPKFWHIWTRDIGYLSLKPVDHEGLCWRKKEKSRRVSISLYFWIRIILR